MTVEVIGEDSTILKETSCKGCGARLRYGSKDVKRDYTTDYTGDHDYYRFVSCPRCGHECHV